MKRSCLLLLLLGLCADLLPAQEASPTPPLPTRRNMWEADMPAGDYLVRLASITSISMHQYIVDASARVTEVTIATSGSEIARFYYLQPITPQMPDGIGQSGVNLIQEKVEGMADRVGLDDWKKVVKNYPMSTHAHTVEYRVGSIDQLNKLFKSVKQSWTQDEGTIFKP